MIITIRGPSGAGKTHLVREIMRDYPIIEPQFQHGRKKPLNYLLRRRSERSLVLLGHYEIANGGVDTLSSLSETYHLIRTFDNEGVDVLYEGKCMSDGATGPRALHQEGRDVRILYLNTPINVCVDSVRARGHRIAEKSITQVAWRCSREYETLGREHLIVQQATRERGLEIVREWLVEARHA